MDYFGNSYFGGHFTGRYFGPEANIDPGAMSAILAGFGTITADLTFTGEAAGGQDWIPLYRRRRSARNA